MDISARSKRKYTSFIFSLLLHCLLLLWFVYTTLKLSKIENTLESNSENKRIPAPLSFDNRVPLPPLPKEPLPALQPLVADTPLELPTPLEDPQESIVERRESTVPVIDPLIQVSPEATQNDTTAHLEADSAPETADEAHSSQKETGSPSQEPYTVPLLTEKGTVPTHHPASRPRRRKKKTTNLPPGLTAAFFVKAFQNAARTGTYTQSPRSQTKSQAPAHVQEQLDELKTSNYEQKISHALLRACRLSQGYLHAQEDVKELLFVRLVIAQDGSFTVEGPTPFTGVKIVDDYLASFFSKLDLPPIPKHLGTDTFVRPITIRISLKKGGNYIELRPMNG